MSFSGLIKEKLAEETDQDRHCDLAELAAILTWCGRERTDEDGNHVFYIHTENAAVLRKCFTLIKKTYIIESEVFICREAGQESAPDRIEIREGELLSEILNSTKLKKTAIPENSFMISNARILQQKCCKKAFIRGAFLCAGSVSDPEKGYHFEIVCQDEKRAVLFQQTAAAFHVQAKIVKRKKVFVAYVKEGEQIANLLRAMGADTALFDLENIRILKEVRNSVNRQVNCETANLNKTVSASVKQIEDIRLIRERMGGFEKLPEGLAQMAQLRLDHADASLKELGELSVPPVGKSGVNHRLRRLSAIALDLRQKEDNQHD
jgi:hypothetical protein